MKMEVKEKMSMIYMRFLIINLVLIVFADAEDQLENEVGEIFRSFAKWQATQGASSMILPDQYREPLEKFSSKEIFQGLLDLFKELDVKSRMTNHQYSSITVIKFNPYLVEDTLPLRQMLEKHDQPREFFHLSGLAFALTRAKNEDFIRRFLTLYSGMEEWPESKVNTLRIMPMMYLCWRMEEL